MQWFFDLEERFLPHDRNHYYFLQLFLLDSWFSPYLREAQPHNIALIQIVIDDLICPGLEVEMAGLVGVVDELDLFQEDLMVELSFGWKSLINH